MSPTWCVVMVQSFIHWLLTVKKKNIYKLTLGIDIKYVNIPFQRDSLPFKIKAKQHTHTHTHIRSPEVKVIKILNLNFSKILKFLPSGLGGQSPWCLLALEGLEVLVPPTKDMRKDFPINLQGISEFSRGQNILAASKLCNSTVP